MTPEFWEWVASWATLIAWLIVASLFFWDSLRVHSRARIEYRRVVQNGGALVARRRKRISAWFVQGSAAGLFAGVLAFTRTAFFGVDSLEAVILMNLTRIDIVYMFFAFWRAKRNNIALYREADAKYRKEVQKAREQTQDERETRDAP